MSIVKRLASFAKTLSIQLLILVLLLAAVEGVARLVERSEGRQGLAALNLTLQPYMMFSARSGEGFTWLNIFKKEKVPSTIVFNNYGYAQDFDYTFVPDAGYLQQHGKKPGERIVLITGGSTVHGVGATSNQKTIASQLQRHLNERANGIRYRVLNMGMGSWIAYQQFIGLSLFGLPFDPDWVVVMDGHNDGAVACVSGSGVGNPLQWAKILFLTQGGLTGDSLLTDLGRRSALVRMISGRDPRKERPLPANLVVDESVKDKRYEVRLKGLKVKDQDHQIDFYVESQRKVASLFHRANIILSSQPLHFDNAVSPSFRPAFSPGSPDTTRTALTADLDKFMAANKDKECSVKQASQLLGYFMGRSALRLTEFAKTADEADPRRRIMYINTEASMPYPVSQRQPYFLDNAHLSDAGQDRIGQLFAEMILSVDNGGAFDYETFVQKVQQQAAVKQ